jgi:hypothetical protein
VASRGGVAEWRHEAAPPGPDIDSAGGGAARRTDRAVRHQDLVVHQRLLGQRRLLVAFGPAAAWRLRAFIGVVGGVGTTVWFDEVTGAQVINELVINRPTGPSAELWMAGGSLSTQFTTVGSTGIGGFVQQGGTHAASRYLMLGRDGLRLREHLCPARRTARDGEHVRGVCNGYGDFKHSGGVHRSASLVLNGRYSQYAMTGGTLQVSGGAQIQGGATFKHSAGSFTTKTMFVGQEHGETVATTWAAAVGS